MGDQLLSRFIPKDGYLAQAQEWEQRAASIQVIDQTTYDAAATVLQGIAALIQEAEAHHNPIITAAHQTHKAALAARAKVTGPLAAALGVIKRKTSVWLDLQERARLAEEARLRAEAENARKAQEALDAQERERERLEAEEAQERALQAAEAAGASREAIQAMIDQAESGPDYPLHKPEPQTVEDLRKSILAGRVEAPPTYTKHAGAGLTYAYSVVVDDLGLLIDAANCVPEAYRKYIQPNLQLLNGEARTLKDGFQPPPGCRLVKTPTTRTSQGF